MKSIKLINRWAVFILITFLAGSCNFLDEKPEDFLSPANFYKTEADARAAVTGIYSNLGYNGGDLLQIGDVTADILKPGEPARQAGIELDTYSYDPTQADLAALWTVLYNAINEANTAIERIPAIQMDADRQGQLIGEAEFLRALFYFDLVRIFGGVPLVLEETKDLASLNVRRATEQEVYDQIISDLQHAEQVLPPSYPASDIGRASQGAAKALLARAYLYTGEFALAAAKSKEVMEMDYALMPIEQLWDPVYENGPEHIFSVQYLAGIKGSGFNATFGVRGAEPPYTGFSSVFVETPFVASFGPLDKRKKISILEYYIRENGDTAFVQPHVFKYFNPDGPEPGDTDTNWPVIRFSEVLLIYAEAINEVEGGPTAEAYAAVNSIRNRAGLPNLPEDMSGGAFRDAVIQERAWELCFEGQRWFDLKRTGKLIEVMTAAGKNVQPKHLLFPIPQREMDVNPELEQNQGY